MLDSHTSSRVLISNNPRCVALFTGEIDNAEIYAKINVVSLLCDAIWIAYKAQAMPRIALFNKHYRRRMPPKQRGNWLIALIFRWSSQYWS